MAANHVHLHKRMLKRVAAAGAGQTSSAPLNVGTDPTNPADPGTGTASGGGASQTSQTQTTANTASSTNTQTQTQSQTQFSPNFTPSIIGSDSSSSTTNTNTKSTSTTGTSTSSGTTSSSTTSTSSSGTTSSSTSLTDFQNTVTMQTTSTRTNLEITPSNHPLSTSSPTGVGTINTATSTAKPSSSLGTGSIVGIAAGGLIGLGVIVMVGMWLMKRYFRSKDHDDDFAPDYRNSIRIEDDPADGYGAGGPRPPTMIERFHGAAGIGAYGNTTYNPGDVVPLPPPASATANPFLTPVGSPISTPYDDAAAAGGYVQRRPTYRNAPPSSSEEEQYRGYPAQTQDQQQYNDLTRTSASVTPYQAEQYHEISKQMQVGPYAFPTPASSSPLRQPSLRATSNSNYSMPSPRAMAPGGGSSSELHSHREVEEEEEEEEEEEVLEPPRGRLMVANGRAESVYEGEDAYGGI